MYGYDVVMFTPTKTYSTTYRGPNDASGHSGIERYLLIPHATNLLPGDIMSLDDEFDEVEDSGGKTCVSRASAVEYWEAESFSPISHTRCLSIMDR